MARPTKYTPELCEKAKAYLTDYSDEHGHAIPSVVGMAIVIGVAKSTLYLWAEDEENEFSDILDECMDAQEQKLVSGGLLSTYNSTITKLILTKHGYHDKADNTLSGPNGTPLQITEVQRTIVDTPDSNS